MKLVLGTANLNQSYGLLKQKTNFSESLKILAFAKNRKKAYRKTDQILV